MNQEPLPISDAEMDKWEGIPLEINEPYRPELEAETPPPKKPRGPLLTKKRLRGAAVGLLVMTAVAVGAYIFLRSPPEAPPTNVVINTQSLDNGTLNDLTDDATGIVKQQLTISPDTLFKNSVSVQGSATVDKDLAVRGNTTLQGTTTINSDLSVNRSLTVVGNTSIASNLTVNGQISAASLTVGSLTISSINLSNDLNFAGHIVPNGAAPSVRASTATGGGTVSITGNDTAGTITITTGGSALTGELAVITFRASFGATPKVQLTPVNEGASTLNYFATKSATFFTVNTSSASSPSRTYIFDYLVTQ